MFIFLLSVRWGVAAFKFLLLNVACFDVLSGVMKTGRQLRVFESEAHFQYSRHIHFSARLILKLRRRKLILFLLLVV